MKWSLGHPRHGIRGLDRRCWASRLRIAAAAAGDPAAGRRGDGGGRDAPAGRHGDRGDRRGRRPDRGGGARAGLAGASTRASAIATDEEILAGAEPGSSATAQLLVPVPRRRARGGLRRPAAGGAARPRAGRAGARPRRPVGIRLADRPRGTARARGGRAPGRVEEAQRWADSARALLRAPAVARRCARRPTPARSPSSR